MKMLSKIHRSVRMIVLVPCLWLAYFAFSYYRTEDENYLLAIIFSTLAYIIIIGIRSYLKGGTPADPDESHKEVWLSKIEIEEHFKSIGHPEYDHSIGTVRGKTAFFDKLKEGADIVNEEKSAEDRAGGNKSPGSK